MDEILTLNMLNVWRDACHDSTMQLNTLTSEIHSCTFGTWEGPAASAAYRELAVCCSGIQEAYERSLSMLTLIDDEILRLTQYA